MNLNELFLLHKGTRSYDDLERACDKALTSQRLQQIATTAPKEFPKARNIRAIARALGVRESVVLLAAAESLGLDVGREIPKLLQVLPAAASDLSDEEVAAIAHVIRAFKTEELRDDARSPANTEAGSPGAGEKKKRGGRVKAVSAEDQRKATAAIADRRRKNDPPPPSPPNKDLQTG